MNPDVASPVASVLFLHGGPGQNARLERAQYGDSLPVHWWDQPAVGADAAEPYEQLAAASLAELQRLSDARAGRVALLASSFGTYLAHTLLERMPDRIAQLTIVGGTRDLRVALVRLGQHIANANRDPQLAEASREASRSADQGPMWRLVERLFGVPNLFDFFWSRAASRQREAMKALVAAGHLLDLPTFQGVLRDVFSRDRAIPATIWRGSVRILIGLHDPYALPGDEVLWRAVFPDASIEWVSAGHFPHLELPPPVWLPRT